MKASVPVVATVGILAVALFGSVRGALNDRRGDQSPRDVTMSGRVVDLQSFMSGKFTSADKVRSSRRCLQAGGPAALVTEEGLVILGAGEKGAVKTIAPLAMRTVTLTGTLYERHGVRYLDIKSVSEIDQDGDAESDEPSETGEPDGDEITSGACCLTGGGCVDTTAVECDAEGGQFHDGESCETVECGE